MVYYAWGAVALLLKHHLLVGLLVSNSWAQDAALRSPRVCGQSLSEPAQSNSNKQHAVAFKLKDLQKLVEGTMVQGAYKRTIGSVATLRGLA